MRSASLTARAVVAGAAVATVLAGTGCSSSPRSAAQPAHATGAPVGAAAAPSAASSGPPVFDPNNFVAVVDNPYYPLTPGTTYVYEGKREGVTQRDEVTVTSRTKVVDGVTAVVVSDVATRGGVLLEKTDDWYAQDKQANVWYLGEATATYKNGKIDSTEGSWQAGVGGAQPGIIMPAHPQIADSFRQEYFRGHAEDTFWVVQDGLKVTVPYRTLTSVVQTLEFTRLEPDVVDSKYYAPGIGIVREVSVAGPVETADLVSVSKR